MYEITTKSRESTGKWEDFFKVLSDETRLRILMLLSQRELCVCEICQVLDLPQPKISRHLAKMRDLNFVKDLKDGQWTFYYLNIEDPLLRNIMHQLSANGHTHAAISNDMERLARKEKSGSMCQRAERISVQVERRK